MYYKRISRKVPLKNRSFYLLSSRQGLEGRFGLPCRPVSVNVLWDGLAVQVVFLSPQTAICCRSGGSSR